MAGNYVDPTYEFNVPQFDDFAMVDDDHNADEREKYFDFDHEKGVPVTPVPLDEFANAEQFGNVVGNDFASAVSDAETKTTASNNDLNSQSHPLTRSQAKVKGTQPTNICTSFSDWHRSKAQSSDDLSKVPKTSNTSKVLSSEEQELEKIKQMRQAAALKHRISQKSLKKAMVGSTTRQTRTNTTAKGTKVKEFTFATDKRIHDHKQGHSAASNAADEKASQPPALWAKTPDRFHSVPRGTKFVPTNKRRRSRSVGTIITIPSTPILMTKARARPAHVVSQAEQDDKIANEITNYRFRARPVNEKIFASMCMGVPRKKVKETTVAVSPNFAERRPKERKAEQQFQNSFIARPIPKGLLDGPQGVKEAFPRPLTRAKTPKITRVRSMDSVVSNEEPEERVIRATPMPDMNQKFDVKIKKSVVLVTPFSFDQRDLAIPMRKQKLIDEENLRLEKLREFKANEAEVLIKPQFVLKPSSQPLTDTTDHRLNTELRNTEREKWEVKKADAERHVATLKAKAQAKLEEEEQKEIERIRREAVHRAQPVRHFQPTIVKQSTAPLTNAQSPKFSRLRRRTQPH